MGLIDSYQGRVSGQILFDNTDLLKLSGRKMQKIRGNKIAMIFQEPMTSLNPVVTCGNQVIEVLKLHRPELSMSERLWQTIELFEMVGIPSPQKRVKEYPHQLSGGMLQRVMIAMGLACRPDILIADEPTTALDVTIQAQILRLLKNLQREFDMSIILITHDLGVVSDVCDEVVVMYCGRVVEKSDVTAIFGSPRHPYTKGLLNSIPSFEAASEETKTALRAIPGRVPSLYEIPQGCSFKDRCEYADEECGNFVMVPREVAKGHLVACRKL
jgi:oligopeptide/dipeptide ABC transporter ATP-binding protein